MKKVLLLLSLMFLWVGAQAQSLRVWMDDMIMVADGTTVTYMTVSMTDADDLYSGFQMGITVPEGITIHQVKSGRVMVNDAKLNEFRFEGLGHSLITNMPDPQTIKVGCMDTRDNAEFYPDDAEGNIVEELFTIGLVASPDMVNGDYTIEMWDVEMIHQNATGVKPSNADLTAKMTITGGQDAASLVVPYTLTAAGYGTLILPFDAALPDGVKAYTCIGVEGNVIVMEEQSSIAANTPLVFCGTPGEYRFEGVSTATDDSYTVGLLTGVYVPTEILSGYVLQTHSGSTAFYHVETPAMVPAYRCSLNEECNSQKLVFADTVEDVNILMNEQAPSQYDLTGRRASGTAKGVLVKDGTKVFRK